MPNGIRPQVLLDANVIALEFHAEYRENFGWFKDTPRDTKHQKNSCILLQKHAIFYDGTDIILHVFCFHQWKWRFSLKSSDVFDFSPIPWMNLMKISIFIDESKIHAWFCPFHEKNVIFSMFCVHGHLMKNETAQWKIQRCLIWQSHESLSDLN